MYQMSPRMLRRRRLLQLGAAGLLGLALARPARAYEVVVDPPNPQLGDTYAILIRPEQPTATAPPLVTLNDSQEFATYPTGDGRFRALIPTSPLDTPGRNVVRVIGEEPTRNLAVWVKNRFFSTQRITLPASRRNLGTDHEFERVGRFRDTVSPEQFWSGPLLRPSQGRTSTPYGVRRYYNGVFAQNYYHRGLDYAAPVGTPVIAPAAGYVRLTGRVADGFELHGNTIGLDHGQGVLSIMIHLSRIDVVEGQFVEAGQQIGAIGNTGASTGPHLHWGFYVNGVAVDPGPWLSRGF